MKYVTFDIYYEDNEVENYDPTKRNQAFEESKKEFNQGFAVFAEEPRLRA